MVVFPTSFDEVLLRFRQLCTNDVSGHKPPVRCVYSQQSTVNIVRGTAITQ